MTDGHCLLLQLPTEVLQAIGSHLSCRYLAEFRLTCSALSRVMRRSMLHAVVFNFGYHQEKMADFYPIAPVVHDLDLRSYETREPSATVLVDVLERCTSLASLTMSLDILVRVNERQFGKISLPGQSIQSKARNARDTERAVAPLVKQLFSTVFTRLTAFKIMSNEGPDAMLLCGILPFLGNLEQLSLEWHVALKPPILDWVRSHCHNLRQLGIHVSNDLTAHSALMPPAPPIDLAAAPDHPLTALELILTMNTLDAALFLMRVQSMFPRVKRLRLQQHRYNYAQPPYSPLFEGGWDDDNALLRDFLQKQELVALASARAFVGLTDVNLNDMHLAPVIRHILFSASKQTLRRVELVDCLTATPRPPDSRTWQNFFFAQLAPHFATITHVRIEHNIVLRSNGTDDQSWRYPGRLLAVTRAFKQGHFSMDVLLDCLPHLTHLTMDGLSIGANAGQHHIVQHPLDPHQATVSEKMALHPLVSCSLSYVFLLDTRDSLTYLSARCRRLEHLHLNKVVMFNAGADMDDQEKSQIQDATSNHPSLQQRVDTLVAFNALSDSRDKVVWLPLPFSHLKTLSIAAICWNNNHIPSQLVVLQSTPTKSSNSPRSSTASSDGQQQAAPPYDADHTCHAFAIRGSANSRVEAHGQPYSGWMIDTLMKSQKELTCVNTPWPFTKSKLKDARKWRKSKILAIVCQRVLHFEYDNGQWANCNLSSTCNKK
ncbi:hypothetical protein BC940DRAFT_291726 [Gongronella butleri]|nr:hypothetical protein BC940DRAFT_291726 [Gongronella butleri]